MSRLEDLPLDRLNPAQRALFDAITGGKRGAGKAPGTYLTPGGGLRGPFNALLRVPHVGDPAQRLGECLRFDGVLPARQREIAVLCVAAHWRADYEWWAHARIAGECGVEEQVIQAIQRNSSPSFADPAERLVHDFSRAMLEEHGVGDRLYGEILAAIGEEALVELVVLLGYYSLVSMLLVAFRVPLPEGETAPFSD